MKTVPIMPKKQENGVIRICKLASDNVAIPVVNAVLDVKPAGSVCVITKTNETALSMVGLLHQNGVHARKIQSSNGFYLCDLAELRDFITDVSANEDSYVITDENWQNAKYNLNHKYEASRDLPGALRLIQDFEETNKAKYKSDFKQFVYESKLEDFTSASENTVLVSTIHQTKGREFDNVFLALGQISGLNDVVKRELYVAVTRAKKNLYIVYHGNYFEYIHAENLQRTSDDTNYPLPAQISFQLSHRDVKLGYFAHWRQEIDSLISGRELSVRDTGCFVGSKEILKFSSAFCDQIDALHAKGYAPAKATVRHVLFWKGKDSAEELKIFLPDVEMEKIR